MSEPQSAEREAWIPLVSTEDVRSQLPPGVTFPYDFGFIPAAARLLLTHPTLGPALGALLGQAMFAPGSLDRGEREMIAAVASAVQSCTY
jgi:hypothetical protein